jgi:hypothetical protein
MRALHANLTPLAHVEVADRRPYGMSEDTIQVWPITGVRSVVNHLALKSAPVPAPTSELRERIGRLWMEAGWAVTALESGQTPDDPLATARRYQGDMNALRTMIDNATFESAPVPAPRLEQEVVDALNEASRLIEDRYADSGWPSNSWWIAVEKWREKLAAVLSSPVGTQE